MTTHKTDAVKAGIMPDFLKAGVVLCRSAEFVTEDDSVVSGDTLQMVPIPKNAKVLELQVYYSDLPDGVTGCDIGYGGDSDAFIQTLPMTGQNIKKYPGCWGRQNPGTADMKNMDNPVGLFHTFTADDTIDIAFTKAPTKIPTSQHIKLSVWYKMVGVISDET